MALVAHRESLELLECMKSKCFSGMVKDVVLVPSKLVLRVLVQDMLVPHKLVLRVLVRNMLVNHSVMHIWQILLCSHRLRGSQCLLVVIESRLKIG